MEKRREVAVTVPAADRRQYSLDVYEPSRAERIVDSSINCFPLAIVYISIKLFST
jgi:hypothetical protein